MEVKTFLQQHRDPERPFLLGLSGGADSLALFHLLEGFDFAVAHIDHGWREESASEAEQLRKLAASKGIEFHLKRLNPDHLSGNLEAACRLERQMFFKELCEQYGYQAVMLGHHRNDQAETVLKRVLEGNALATLSGMKEVACIDGVTYWRPLLSVGKKTILEWAEREGLHYFHDATNDDTRFMRANMRASIIPQLSKTYGKEIAEPLVRLGAEAQLLADYLEKQTESHAINEGPLGLYLLLPVGMHILEIRFLLRKLCRKAALVPTHHQLEAIVSCLDKANCSVDINGKTLYIDRRQIFVPETAAPDLSESVSLKEGTTQMGPWQVDVATTKQTMPATGWSDLWQGRAEVTLAKGDYVIGAARNAPFNGTTPVSKWWTNHKVPTFLRRYAPAIWEGEMIRHEFLTGRVKCFDRNLLSFLKVTLTWLG